LLNAARSSQSAGRRNRPPFNAERVVGAPTLEAERFEAAQVMALEVVAISAIEEVRSEVLVGHLVGEHDVEGPEQRVLHRHQGAGLSLAGEAMVAGVDVGPFAATSPDYSRVVM
jgi:hypothetical protein